MTAALEVSTVHSSEESDSSLTVSTDVPMDSGKPEPTSPPVDTEAQDASLKQSMGEDQPEQELDRNECAQETMKAEETHTSELENRDCNSSPAEEETEGTHLSGGNARTAGHGNEMTMSREECHHGERLPSLSEESPARQHQNGAKPSPSFVMDADFKLKPSNQLARQYVPRPGMSTFTIVPSKPLEKLKYFEVELTLEDPAVVLKENEALGCPKPATHDPDPDELHVSVDLPECSVTQGEELSNGTVTNEDAHCGQAAATPPVPADAEEESCQPSSSNTGDFETGPDLEIKEKKVPPTVKPKPDVYHLPLQKSISVEYVTSVETKNNACAISHCGQEEERKEESVGAKEEKSFPAPPAQTPPPPPHPHTGQEAERQRDDELMSKGASSPGDGSTRRATNGLERPGEPRLKELASSATPKSHGPAEPSPFCKAVFAAIKRSQGSAPPVQPPASRLLVSGTVGMSAEGQK